MDCDRCQQEVLACTCPEGPVLFVSAEEFDRLTAWLDAPSDPAEVRRIRALFDRAQASQIQIVAPD